MSLKKHLSLLDVFCISTGAMISSGIFILPGMAYANTGPLVCISYFLAGIMALIGVLSVIELSTAMPMAGGDYYFVTRSLGPFAGTIAGLFSWFAISLKSAFAIFGMAEIIFILTGFPLTITAIILALIFLGINMYGVKEAAFLEVILVVVLLVLMILYVIIGFFHINIGHFNPLVPKGVNSIFITSGFVFVSFGGLISVTSISEEVKKPKKNIPMGMLLSVIVVTILYALVLYVTVGVIPGEKLSNTLTPVADAANRFLGPTGYIIISVAAAFAFITTAIAGIMSASRYPVALSRDLLLPSVFKFLNSRNQMPLNSLLLTGAFIILSLLLPLETLVKAASTVILSANVFANIAVIILRESKILNYKPSFKTPLYPFLQIISIIIFSIFIIDMGLATIEISLGLFLCAVFVFLVYGRSKTSNKSAIIHLVARIKNKKLETDILEEELREIVIQRDNIVFDEVDKAIKEADVIDIDDEKKLNSEDCFKILSDSLVQCINEDSNTLQKMFKQRELESSTALNDSVAVPHVIIDGDHKFSIVIMRSKEGIFFSEQHPSIKAVFAIIGTKDERNLHLRTLAAIAQAIAKKQFLANWLEAKNEGQLRDIILMAERWR